MQKSDALTKSPAAAATENYNWKNVPIGGGGYTRAIIAHPSNPDVVYIRTDVGGAYRWHQSADATDGYWSQLINFPQYAQSSLFGVDSIAVDPSATSDPSTTTIYASMGKSTAPEGIYKSTDGGTTWSSALSGTTSLNINANIQLAKAGERLAIDPNNSNIVYYSSRVNGLLKTTTGGAFSAVSSFTDVGGAGVGDFQSSGAPNAGLTFVAFDKSSGVDSNNATKTIFVGSFQTGVYKSIDAGVNWSLITSGNTATQPKYPIRAVVDPSGNLFVTDHLGVYKYTNSSSTWSNITPTIDSGTTNCPSPTSTSEYGGISFDPITPTNIAVLKSCQQEGVNHIYYSTNGGSTWVYYVNKTNVSIATTDWLSSTASNQYFLSYPAGLVIDRAGRLWATDGASIWRTTDINSSITQASKPTTTWYRMYKGHEELVVNNMFSFSDGRLLTTTSDVHGFMHSDLNTYPTSKFASTLSFSDIASFDYSETDNTFMTLSGGHRDDTSISPFGAYYSTNSGSTWTKLPQPQTTSIAGRLAVGTPSSPANAKRIVWVPENDKPYYMDHNGSSWSQGVSTDTVNAPFDSQCNAVPEYWNYENYDVLASDHASTNTFYYYEPKWDSALSLCGTKKGILYKSTDGGATFAPIKTFTFTGLTKRPRVNMKTVPGKAGNVWLSIQGTCAECGLYYTEDGGSSFSTKLTNLSYVQTFDFSTTGPGKTYPSIFLMGKVSSTYDSSISSVEHVFRSDDKGTNWIVVDNNSNLALFNGNGVLEGDRNDYKQVYIGTSGNGVIYGEPQTTSITIASDSFSRSVTNGWNSADVGGAYTLTGTASAFTVGSGVGTTVNTAGATRQGALETVSSVDSNQLVKINIDKVSSGNGLYVEILSRKTSGANNFYLSKFRFANNSNIYLSASKFLNSAETTLSAETMLSSPTFTPGSNYWLRMETIGTSPTTINLKVWPDGSLEPGNAQYTITDSDSSLQSAGGVGLRSYASGNITNAPITFTFDDYSATMTTPTVQFSSTTGSGSESATSVNIPVTLSAVSPISTTVNYAVTAGTATGGTDYNISGGTLTIPAGSTTANIPITVINDNNVEDSETIQITLSSPVNADLGTNTVFTYTIQDNDTAGVTVTQSSGTTQVIEGGSTDSYTLVLTSQPSSNVVITPSFNSAQISLSLSTITFTSLNWNTPQTITVTAVNDFLVEGNISYNITHTASSSDTNYNGISIAAVSALVTDNDTADVTISQSGGTTNVTEGGATDNYTLVLTSQPNANVTINIDSGSQLTVNPASLTFTSSNWFTPQSVTVTAIDDAVAEGNHTGIISHTSTSSDSNFNALTINNLTVNITDNDSAGVALLESSGNTTVIENDTGDSFTVKLTTAPVSNVTINISPGTGLSVSPTSLVFTSQNWNSPQTVSVSGVNDNYAQGNRTVNITFSAVSTDGNYNSITISSIGVNIIEDDTASVNINESGLNTQVVEGGTTDNITIKLTSQPTNDVTISISNNAQLAISPTTLTFTNANWNILQTVTFTAVDDSISQGNRSTNINMSLTSSDNGYNGMQVLNFPVLINDNDTPSVIVTETASSTSVTEGGSSDTYSIKLGSEPTNDVAISLNPSSELFLDQSVITFTNLDWNTPQLITVNAVDDSIYQGNRTAVINYSVSSIDSNYNNYSIPSLNVNITDNDPFPISNPTNTPVPTLTNTPIPTITPTATNTPLPTNTNNPTPTSISYKQYGDFNGDKKVDLTDLSLLAQYWQQSNSIADTNGDGKVDLTDLSILAQNWLMSF